MPTSSTAEIRSWARSKGLAVADRGRLAPEILAAHALAVGEPVAEPAQATAAQTLAKKAPVKKAPVKKTSVKKAPVKKAPAKTSPATSKSATARRPVGEPSTARQPAPNQRPAQSLWVSEPADAPAPPTAPPSPEQGKTDALEKAIVALAARVTALESRGKGKKGSARKS